ncbi:MAG: flagellar biosynthesis protein FlhA [Phycisphaeraceae bacterium]|nr:flagellar biosynthesis protein FlhA [Phycisphaeraceae bacterium]
MAAETPQLILPAWLNRVGRYQAFFVPVAIVALLAVIVVPLPTFLMDLLLTLNVAMASMILLTTIFVQSPLDFSVFPSLLLVTTLFRLVLNIATTRLILGAEAETAEAASGVAGKVIEAFARFVSSGNLVVGFVLFVILIVVQFVVITKGATRISEVAARFTLDAMPGKQMAIDADLNAGLINEAEARKRREMIAQEADFYGAMDGAGKFVRGDAVAGIIIVLINIIGGLAVGVLEKGWTIGQSLDVFTRLTIGDGLVSQLPAFVISLAAGLIVTRSSGRQDLGTSIASQLTSRWRALAITSGFLTALSFTGLPAMPLLALAAVTGGLAYAARKGETQKQVVAAQAAAAASKPAPPPVEQVMAVDAMELEVGYALVKLVDTSQGGDLLDRISLVRRQLATEMGLVMPPVRIRDNMQLQPHDYQIKIRSNAVGKGAVYPGQHLAMDSGLASEPLQGRRTREPAFGLAATWIDPGQKERAEALSYTVVDAASVLVTHLTEVVRNHAHELLTREETANLIEQLKGKSPKLVEEVLGGEGKLLKPGDLQKVLQNLLRERVPIRDMEAIVETLGDWAPRTRDMEVLTEYVRNALRRTICNQYVQVVPVQPLDDDAPPTSAARLYCVSLDPALEDRIASYIERTAEGSTMSMPPAVANRVVSAIVREISRLIQAGHPPVVLASPQVRAQVRRLIEPHLPIAAVLGYNEVSKGVEVESLGLVQLEDQPAPARVMEGALR